MRDITYHLTENHCKNNVMLWYERESSPENNEFRPPIGFYESEKERKETTNEMLLNEAAGIAYCMKFTIGSCTPSQKKSIILCDELVYCFGLVFVNNGLRYDSNLLVF